MTSKTNTFDGQTTGTTWSVAGSGGGSLDAFDSLTQSGTVTGVYDNGELLITANATSTYNPRWTTGLNGAQAAIRIVFRLLASSAAQDFVNARHSGGACATLGISAGNALQIKDAAGATKKTFGALTIGSRYTVQIGIIPNASISAGTITCDLYAGDSTTPTETGYAGTGSVNAGTGNVSELRVGKLTSTPSLTLAIESVSIVDTQSTSLGPFFRAGTGVGALTIAGNGVGVKSGAGAGQCTLTVTGSGVGAKTAAGSGAGLLTLSGTGSGAKRGQGAGVSTLVVTGNGAGAKRGIGAGVGALTVTGNGSGWEQVGGSGQCTLTVTGNGSGFAEEPDIRFGSGVGVLTVSGDGYGAKEGRGSGSGLITMAGDGDGTKATTGAGVCTLTLTGNGQGVVGEPAGPPVRLTVGQASWAPPPVTIGAASWEPSPLTIGEATWE